MAQGVYLLVVRLKTNKKIVCHQLLFSKYYTLKINIKYISKSFVFTTQLITIVMSIETIDHHLSLYEICQSQLKFIETIDHHLSLYVRYVSPS